jgi:endonuclease YncB( thermonuclease family)
MLRRRRLRLFRRRRGLGVTIVAVAIVVVVAIAVGARGGGDDEPSPTAPSMSLGGATATASGVTATAPTLDLGVDRSLLVSAEVVDIIDGDTIDVRVAGREERVRYYGVDTTERGEDCYREATARNEALAGDTVLLLPDVRDRDRYSRLLRYAFTEDGRSIEATLIEEGLGYAWRDDGAYRDELIEAEEAAEARGVGCLWD